MIGGLRYCSWAPDVLLRDPRVRRMDATTLGAFTSLLIEMWMDPDGTLPDDPEELALLSRLGKSGWSKQESKLRPLFHSENGRLSSEIIDEARERALKRSDIARNAVEARIEKYRKVEPNQPSEDDPKIIEGSSDDKPKIIAGSSKEKEKEKVKGMVKGNVKEGGKPPKSPSGLSFMVEFTIFTSAWKALKSTRPFNSRETWKSYSKALARGATDGDLLQAVILYDRYLTKREKAGKSDVRDFIPQAETWLNQDRWVSEYPDEEVESTDPVSGRDFYWHSYKKDGEDYVGKYKLGPSGEKTEIPFDLEAWRASKK